ncbi:MAG: hypothetical protein NWQ45_09730, partial [Congregibacter sp.]|nr:hypothetical protein [Congregibacter sp.]
GGEPERALALARSIALQSPWASHVAQSRAYRAQGLADRQLEQLLLAYSLDARDLLVNFEIADVFVNMGLLDEALRIDRAVRPWALLGARMFEDAEQALRAELAADPGSLEIISSLAASIYYQGRFAEAVELWQQAMVPTTYGEVVYANGGKSATAQLVYALQQLDQQEAAADQLKILEDLEANSGEAGFNTNRWWFFGQTMLAALEKDKDAALKALQTADSKGFASLSWLDEPILNVIRDEPAFEIIRQNVATRAMANREKVLTLICENNPVPDHWRPLEATCTDL